MPLQHARGVALLIVLWIVALMVVLLGAFSLVSRTESLEARHLLDSTAARYAAESGLSRAVYELQRPNPLTRWVPDGRPYPIQVEDAEVEVRITDEGGKIDLNAADEKTLHDLFLIAGVDEDRASKLADAIMDWRDPDELVRANGAEDADYDAAGLSYGAGDAPFALVGEVQQVLGMDYELFRKLRPWLTVYSRSPRPNFAFAPAELLQLVPGVTAELAAQFVAQRGQTQPGDPAAAALRLPDGTPLLAGGGSGTYTVKSLAKLGNGAWSGLTATVRLGGAPGNRAYTILEWRRGNYD
jgi:general secretion pathway protein K